MKFLKQIREGDTSVEFSKKVLNTVMILILGVLLGVFSKWLDNLPLDYDVWWHRIIGTIDLRNVFSSLEIWLLLALCISIYSNTSLRAGINVFVSKLLL